jgi:hypothetical protein
VTDTIPSPSTAPTAPKGIDWEAWWSETAIGWKVDPDTRGPFTDAEIAARVGCNRSSATRARHALQRKHAKRSAIAHGAIAPPGYHHAEVKTRLDAKGGVVGRTVTTRLGDREVADDDAIPKGHFVERATVTLNGNNEVERRYLKTKANGPAPSILDAVRAIVEQAESVPEIAPPAVVSAPDMLNVIPVGDLHVGEYIWGEECGEDWDLADIDAVVRRATRSLLAMAPPADECAIVILGDGVHADDQTNRTKRSGHQLDVACRHRLSRRVFARLVRFMIEAALETHQKVSARVLVGNHDDETSAAVELALEMLFENNPRVTVVDDPSPFWFRRHGDCFLAALHGDACKPEKFPGVMATQEPTAELWGGSRYRYAYSGHVHKSRVVLDEEWGVPVESMRILNPRGPYPTRSGYRSGRELNIDAWHKTRGKLGRATFEVGM